MQAGQVKSRQRVSDHGEVFTSQREVDAMLDLVKQETERIDSTFLEPACGNGNFLAAILERKLNVVVRNYSRSQYDFEQRLIEAVSSLYGIDILEDNIKEARVRLLEIVEIRYRSVFKNKIRSEVLASCAYLMEKNLIWGDALDYTLCDVAAFTFEPIGRPTLESLRNEKRPIVFSEWKFKNSHVQRRDFIFKEVAESVGIENPLFPPEAIVFRSIIDFPQVHFLKLSTSYGD